MCIFCLQFVSRGVSLIPNDQILPCCLRTQGGWEHRADPSPPSPHRRKNYRLTKGTRHRGEGNEGIVRQSRNTRGTAPVGAFCSARSLTYDSGEVMGTVLSSTWLGMTLNWSPACFKRYFRRGDWDARIKILELSIEFISNGYQMTYGFTMDQGCSLKTSK